MLDAPAEQAVRHGLDLDLPALARVARVAQADAVVERVEAASGHAVHAQQCLAADVGDQLQRTAGEGVRCGDRRAEAGGAVTHGPGVADGDRALLAVQEDAEARDLLAMPVAPGADLVDADGQGVQTLAQAVAAVHGRRWRAGVEGASGVIGRV